MFVLLIFARLASRAPDKRSARLGVRLGEVILAGAITANVAVVAAALGAYRERMVLALMPHGPVELAAYSLAIALYLQDRRRNLPAAYVAKARRGVRGAAGDRRRAGDMGERMSPGRTLLALVALAAGLAIGVPLLSNSLHKLGAQGWFHANATKGGLIQPATPTPQTTPVTGLLQPPTPAPAPGSPHPDAHSHRADADGRRNSALAHRSPSRGQPPRDPAPRASSHARPLTRHRAQPGGLLPAATLHALIKAGVGDRHRRRADRRCCS